MFTSMSISVAAGMLLGLGASASWALANVAIQRAGRAIGALQGLLWAQIVGIGMAVAGAALLGERPAALTAGDGAWIAVSGVAGLTAYACIFYAFEHGRLTLAVPIMSSWAVLASALSLLLFHERLSPGQLVGAAAVIAGAIVVARHAQRGGGAGDGNVRRWLPAAVGAAIGFGILIPAMRRLTPVFGPVGTIAVVYAADLALALPLALASRIGLRLPPASAWPAILLSGFFETAGSACITLGARRAPLAIVSPLASLAAAFTVLYAWAVLRERPARGVLVGAALVSVGVVVLAL
jgi:drug/metabolite transporter (DMT)-like permease